MKYYLDEDISYKVADILKRRDIDAISVHEVAMAQAPDQKQLEFAVSEGRALVTRNRDDYIQLTVRFFNDYRPHHGVLIIPHTIPGDDFSLIARALEGYASNHPEGTEPYTIDFLGVHTQYAGR